MVEGVEGVEGLRLPAESRAVEVVKVVEEVEGRLREIEERS